jgi:hypothetical protein
MRGQSAAAAAVWLMLSGRLRRARRARRDDSFMEFYDISHESIISSSGAGLDLNYDKVQPTKITHFVKKPGCTVVAAMRRRRGVRDDDDGQTMGRTNSLS